jgi:hypothetical protein
MRAALRTTKPRTVARCVARAACPPPNPVARQTESDKPLPPCSPEAEKTLDESSLRALLAVFELLDQWDLEENDDEE